MEDIADFLNSNKRFERYEIHAGTVAGRIVSELRAPKKLSRRDNNDTTYAQKHIAENRSQMLQSYGDKWDDADNDCIDDDIYERYNFNLRSLSNFDLPILAHEREILDAIETNTAIVLYGATGSGKTTQVPQFILDDACARRKYCSIVVTQPRRMAASTNANRVAVERGWKPTTVVGYQIGLDQRANFTDDTRILYCTTGILLERLIQSHDFGHFTHIIIDEVHERSKEIDFLLIVIKKLLAEAPTKPNVKFILMSATIDADAFANYFELPNGVELVPAQIIRIHQKSNYKVREFYFDDLMTLSPKSENIKFLLDEPAIDDELYSIAVNLIKRLGIIDAEEFSMVRGGIENPAVLVFLPGINEINRMRSVLMDKWQNSNPASKLLCVVLHSMSNDHQRALAMQPAEPNVHKIILATTIAESSITVPDVKYVIDFCLIRTLVTDRSTNFTSLQLNWTARNNCEQRMGRAGRVMDGRCYRFVTRYFYENFMLETLSPELTRVPLENIVLKAKKLNMGSPESVLALAMDKPKLSDIATTILVLKEAGALLRTSDGVYTELDGDLTFIGRVMADLPVDIKIARFIVLGHCFGVLEECLVIGAAMSCSRKMFKLSDSLRGGMQSYALILRWANGTGSDLLAMYNAYKLWSHQHDCGTKGNRKPLDRYATEWAEKYGIDLDAMYECKQLVQELGMRLERLGIVVELGAKHVQWHSDKPLILKTVIAGAFYPNFFVRKIPDNDYPRDAFRTIDGHDPRNTVYFKGFPRNNIRCLYTKAIKDFFAKNGIVDAEHLEDVRVSFDEGTEKAYVTFKAMMPDRDYEGDYGVERMPGKIENEVYKAVKMRKMRVRNSLWVIDSIETEMKYAQECGLEIDSSYNQLTNLPHMDRICVPRALVVSMVGYVTHIRSCNQFWFQPMEQYYEIKSFNQSLIQSRKNLVKRFDGADEISVGQVLLVKTQLPFESAAEYYRAKVLHIKCSSRASKAYRLFLIDFGITDHFEFDYLRDPQMVASDFMELPPRCFECSLAELQPSTINCPNGVWPRESLKCFEKYTKDGEVEADIYSVANGIVHVFIHSLVAKANLNDVLIKFGFAEFSQESYASQTNHNERIEKQNVHTSWSRENNVESSYIKYLSHDSSTQLALPPRHICTKEIRLQGPFSPLEISVHSMTEACRMRTVKIDSHSVCSVILDNDPHQKSERYMVAASVGDAAIMNELSVRATTMMPNIRGFGALMALIFCPTIEMKRNDEKTKYVALRTGLGYENDQPIFEEHDIIFNLDSEITLDDIQEVNKIRDCLNALLQTFSGQGRRPKNHGVQDKAALTVKIKDLVIRLLGKFRSPIETGTVTHSWNSYDAADTMKSDVDDFYGDRAIFPLHRAVKIYTKDELYAEEMRQHCDHLKSLAKSNGKSSGNQKILCKLCMCWTDTLFQLRGHLKCPTHCKKYYQICHD